MIYLSVLPKTKDKNNYIHSIYKTIPPKSVTPLKETFFSLNFSGRISNKQRDYMGIETVLLHRNQFSSHFNYVAWIFNLSHAILHPLQQRWQNMQQDTRVQKYSPQISESNCLKIFKQFYTSSCIIKQHKLYLTRQDTSITLKCLQWSLHTSLWWKHLVPQSEQLNNALRHISYHKIIQS